MLAKHFGGRYLERPLAFRFCTPFSHRHHFTRPVDFEDVVMVDFEDFVWSNVERNVTKFAPHEALKLIA